MLYGVLVGIDAILAVILITLILIQRGRGAEVGAAFGAGASASIFGARGVVSFLTKLVAVLSAVFLLNSLLLTYVANRDFVSQSVVERSVEERSEIDQKIDAEIESLHPEVAPDANVTATDKDVFGSAPSTVPEVPD